MSVTPKYKTAIVKKIEQGPRGFPGAKAMSSGVSSWNELSDRPVNVSYWTNDAGYLTATHLSDYNHANIAHGETAYGWGNHASAGYASSNTPSFTGKITQLCNLNYSELAYLKNTNVNGYGLAIAAGSTTEYILSLANKSDEQQFAFLANGNFTATGSATCGSFKTTDFELVQSGSDFLLKYQGTTIIKISSAGYLKAKDDIEPKASV